VLRPAREAHEVACWRWPDIVEKGAQREIPEPRRGYGGRTPLLDVENLSVTYGTGPRSFTALQDVSLQVAESETFAIVGESGSGKSTLARAICGMVTPSRGRISLSGTPLAGTVRERTPEQRRLIQYIFQNPDASLNPRAKVGATLARPLEFFFGTRAGDARARVAAALSDVRLDASYAERYPDQLSGGERQRVAIARALIAEPALLLCDEVLSALDVSVQANILALLQKLKREKAITMLFISHDLAVVRLLSDRVCVLFRGEIMEVGERDQVFRAPFHPYTHSLLEAVPSPTRRRKARERQHIESGTAKPGRGCVYAVRCAWKKGAVCDEEAPPWRETPEGLRLRCHHSLAELSARAEWSTAAAPVRETAA
jgi:peptide/nickel transport system ATP-binding protein